MLACIHTYIYTCICNIHACEDRDTETTNNDDNNKDDDVTITAIITMTMMWSFFATSGSFAQAAYCTSPPQGTSHYKARGRPPSHYKARGRPPSDDNVRGRSFNMRPRPRHHHRNVLVRHECLAARAASLLPPHLPATAAPRRLGQAAQPYICPENWPRPCKYGPCPYCCCRRYMSALMFA